MRNGITFDEQEFMALYNASGTRRGLIDALEEMHGYLGEEDAELRAFTESCVGKLKAMSDEEYRGMELDSVLDSFLDLISALSFPLRSMFMI